MCIRDSLYRDHGENAGDLVVLGVANPKTQEHPQNSDVSVDEVKAFVEDAVSYTHLDVYKRQR